MDYTVVTRADLAFGLSLMSHLGEGNISMSPTSIRLALAMLREGATGDTAKEISRAAVLPEDAATRQACMKEITGSLNETGPCILRCANGLWVDKGYAILPDFSKVLVDSYMAAVQSADFQRNPEEERVNINKYVAEKTAGKIPEFLAEGSVYDLAMLLLNATYFKAPWENKFNIKFTEDQKYTLSSGEKIQVAMMRKGKVERSEELPKFHYARLSDAQVVMLPYQGHKLEAMFLLPSRGTSVRALEARLRNDKFDLKELRNDMRRESFARLEIPTHEIRGDYDLEVPLKAMGIDKMFGDEAEFDGITGYTHLYVSKGMHKTFFRTNEEGSEGAAVTGFALRSLSVHLSNPVEFVADRPFLEAVVDTQTGAVLFLNRIEDPR